MEVNLSVSLLYAGLLTVLYIVLSAAVIRVRLRDKVGIGTGGSHALEVAVRSHGNFAEYVPLALILLITMDMVGASAMLLHGLGAALFIARISYSLAIMKSAGPSLGRQIGVLGTFAVLLVQAGYLIGRFIGQSI